MEVKAGYKQTEVGIIPDDWQVMTLAKVCKMKSGESITGVNIDEFSEYPCYGGNGKYALVGRQGALCGNVLEVSGKFFASEHAVVVTPFEQTDIEWLTYVLEDMKLNQYSESSAQPGLSVAKILNLDLAVPPVKAEQEAIAEALSDTDALIEALEGLLAKKRQVKQGAMQELLTGKRRLVESGKWEVKSLRELGSTFGGLTGKTKLDFGHGTASYITFMNIMSNVVIDTKSFEMVNIKPTETQNRVKKGDLFFNGSSETPEEVGMCAVLLEDIQGVFLNSFCFGFRFREDAKVNGLYFAYFFRSQEGRELMKSLAQGATRYNLSKTALLRLSFPLPDEKEQTAIAEILSDMDAEIAALEGKLSKAREVKQGMMFVLLTGRIRLVES